MQRVRDFLRDLIRYPSMLGTLIANLAPLWGVGAFGWGVGPLVVLYWLENVIVGFITIFRMLLTGVNSFGAGVSLAFVVPFFCFHYGMFCFVHGIFVMVLASWSNPNIGSIVGHGPVGLFSTALSYAPGMLPVLLVIGVWRVVLMMVHFVGRGAYRTSNPMEEMGKPYGRIITLHFAIFAGAFAMIVLQQPSWGMFGLIALKTLFDLFGVRKEAKDEGKSEPFGTESRRKTAEAYAQLDQAIRSHLGPRRPPAG